MNPTLSPDAGEMLLFLERGGTIYLPLLTSPEVRQAAMAELLDHGCIGELGDITPVGRTWLDAQGASK